jgi:hypothetical protein
MTTAQVPDTAPPSSPPPPVAAADPPIGWGDKLVVILFLTGVALFGLISLVDLMRNAFR